MTEKTNSQHQIPLLGRIINRFFRETWAVWTLAFFYYFGVFLYDNYKSILIIGLIIILSLAALWLTKQFIFRKYGCKICNKTGKLEGENEMLGLEFNQHKCYACHGYGLVYLPHAEWYKIAIKAEKMMIMQKGRCLKLKGDISKHKNEINIGSNLKDGNFHFTKEVQEKKLNTQLELEKTQRDLFEVLKIKAHLIMHKKHLHRLQNLWEKKIAEYSADSIERFSSTMADGEDVRLSNLFETEINYLNSYIDTAIDEDYTNELIGDVKRATAKLRKEFFVKPPQLAESH